MWLFGSSRTKQEQEYIQTMKNELLDVVTLATRQSAKDLLQFKEYILKLKSKLAQPTAEKEHAVHGLVDSVKEIIKSKTLDSGPKFFALLTLKEVMETPNPELLAYVQKKIMSRLHDLADFQRDEPNLETKAPYVLHQYNPDSDPVWSRRFFILNLECLHQWATAFPHSPQGGASAFKTYHDKLIEHGVSFLVKDPQSHFVDDKLKKLEEAAKARDGRSSVQNTQENEHARAERSSAGPQPDRQDTQNKPKEVSRADKAQTQESLDDLWQDLVYLVLQGDSTAYLLEHIDNAMENMVTGLKQSESELHREYFQKFLKLWRVQSRNFETEDQVEAIRALNTLQIAMKKLNREFEQARKQSMPEKPQSDPEEGGQDEGEEEEVHPSQDSRGHAWAGQSQQEPAVEASKIISKQLPESAFGGQSDPATLFGQKAAWDVPFMNDGAWGNEEAEKDDPVADRSNNSKKLKHAAEIKFGDNFWFSSPEAGKQEPQPTPSFPAVVGVRDTVAAPVKIGARPTGGFQFDDASVASAKGAIDLDDFEDASQSQPEKSFRSGKPSVNGHSRRNMADRQPSESVTFKNPAEPRGNTLQPPAGTDSRRTIDPNGPAAAVRRSFAELWADDDQHDEDGAANGKVHRSMLHRLNVSKERTTRLGTSLAIGRAVPRITTDIREGADVIKSGGHPIHVPEGREPRRGGIHASAESRESSGSKRPARDSNVMLRGKPMDSAYATSQPHGIQPKLEKSVVGDDHIAEVAKDHSSNQGFDDPWAAVPGQPAEPISDSKFDNFFGNPIITTNQDFGQDFFGTDTRATKIQDPSLPEHAASTEAVQNWFAAQPEEPPAHAPAAPTAFKEPEVPEKEASGFRDRSGHAVSGNGFDLDDFEAASDDAGQQSQQHALHNENLNHFGDDIDLDGITGKPGAEPDQQPQNPPAEDQPVYWGQTPPSNMGQPLEDQQSGRDLEEMMGTDIFQSQPSKPSKLQPWVFTSGDVPADPTQVGEGEVGTPDHFNPFEFEREGGIDHQTPPQSDFRKITKTYQTEPILAIGVNQSPEHQPNLEGPSANLQGNPLQLHKLGTLFTRKSASSRSQPVTLTANRIAGAFIAPQKATVDRTDRTEGTTRSAADAQTILSLQKEVSQQKVDLNFLKAELERKNTKILEVEKNLSLANQSVKSLEQKEIEQYEQLYTSQKNQEELQDNLRELISKHTSLMKELEESQRQERLLRFEVQTLKRQKPLLEGGLKADRATAESGGMSSTPSLERALKDRMETLLNKTVEMQQRILELESDATMATQKGQFDSSVMENLVLRCQTLTQTVGDKNDEIERQQKRIQDLETCEQECKVIMELASLATSEGEVLRKKFWEWIKPTQGDLASSLLVHFLRTQGTSSVERAPNGSSAKNTQETSPETSMKHKLTLVTNTSSVHHVNGTSNEVPVDDKLGSTVDPNLQLMEKKGFPEGRHIKHSGEVQPYKVIVTEHHSPTNATKTDLGQSSITGTTLGKILLGASAAGSTKKAVQPKEDTKEISTNLAANGEAGANPEVLIATEAEKPIYVGTSNADDTLETQKIEQSLEDLANSIKETKNMSKSAFIEMIFQPSYELSARRKLLPTSGGEHFQLEAYLLKDSLILSNPIANEMPARVSAATFTAPNHSEDIQTLSGATMNPGDSTELPLPSWVCEAALWPSLSLTLSQSAASVVFQLPYSAAHTATSLPAPSSTPSWPPICTLTLSDLSPDTTTRALSLLHERFPTGLRTDTHHSWLLTLPTLHAPVLLRVGLHQPHTLVLDACVAPDVRPSDTLDTQQRQRVLGSLLHTTGLLFASRPTNTTNTN